MGLFRFTTAQDNVLISIGITAAIVSAFGIPLMGYAHSFMLSSLVAYSRGKRADKNLPTAEKRTFCLKENFSSSDVPRLQEHFQSVLTNFCIFTIFIGVIVTISSYIMLICINYASERQALHIRKLLFRQIITQDISWHDLHDAGELMSILQFEVHKLQEGTGEKFILFIHFSSAFLGNVLISLILGWELALVLFAALPILVGLTAVIGKSQTYLADNEKRAYSIAGSIAQEAIQAIRTVVSFCGELKEVERYDAALDHAQKQGKNRGLLTGIGISLIWFVTYSMFALGYLYGSKLIIHSCEDETYEYTEGRVFDIFYNVLFAAMNLGQAFPYLENITDANSSSKRIWEILDRPSAIDSYSKRGIKPDSLEGMIEMTDVYFFYPSRPDITILQGLNLAIFPGETVALVGPSGGGKSTILQLLMHLYKPVQGSILLDGLDLCDINVSWYRDKIGIVGQEPVLFSGTIAENIRCGRQDVSDEDIERAGMEANIHDFIMSLPMKYDTNLSGGGAYLSGGQKQRIAIARALLKNPKILLLDEATSALDTDSERLVHLALDRARKNRTTIVVAHRLSTIKNADKILVIADGQEVEEGTHDELMRQRELYFNLVSLQMFPDKDVERDESIVSVDDRFLKSGTKVPTFASRPGKMSVSFPMLSESDGASSYSRRMSTTRSSGLSFSVVEDNDDLQKEEKLMPSKSTVWRIMKLNSPEWPFILFGCLASMLFGITWPCSSILTAEVLWAFQADDVKYVEKHSRKLSLLFFVIATLAAVSIFFQPFLFSFSGSRLTKRIRKLTFAAILKQEMAWFDEPQNNTGNLCSRLAVDAARIQEVTGPTLGAMIQCLSTVFFCLLMSFYYYWELTLYSCFSIPLIFFTNYFQNRILMEQFSESEANYEEAWQIANESFVNIRTIAAMNNEEYFDRKFSESLPVPAFYNKSKQIRSLIFGVSQGAVFLCFAVCWYIGGHYIVYRNLEFRNVSKITEMLIFGALWVSQAVAFSPGFMTATIAASQIFEIWDRQPLIANKEQALRPRRFKPTFSFENVCFHYPTRPEVLVLNTLNLIIESNKTVALVGGSGSGKSTCIQLLERYYDPDFGRIMMHGYDLGTLDLDWLRGNISIVSQEPILFNRTIEENIAYGDNIRKVDMVEIIAAAKAANIHTFIQSLPEGYNTMVGSKGSFLSGGQKQRIAIARALVRNPRFLLLDEATSALDTESEKVVQKALEEAREGRTCVVIAHRLSTIRNADKIVFIQHGQNMEEGTHQQLMAKKGLYYNLHSADTGMDVTTIMRARKQSMRSITSLRY